MNRPRRTQRGVGLVVTVFCIVFAVSVLGALTMRVTDLTLATCRAVLSVRARALADAGVEAALVKVRAGAPRAVEPFEIVLPDGVCSVRVTGDPVRKGVFRVVSEGRLAQADAAAVCRVTVEVVADGPDDDEDPRILSRSEDHRFERTRPNRPGP
ncbi:MAG TPA: hypothetical protein VMX57_02085 [Planctomycetota bacterium]|nr:hypothetical protein [Planctomycetota bacterium]